MATGTYAPDPDLHIVDANGVPVPGGLVWTYIAGTLTPTPTYTDVGLLVPNTNPIVAGSDGRFVAFLAGGISYKFVYEMPAVPPAHGATIATRDNILAVTTIVPGTGGGITQYTSLTGTVNDFPLIPGCSVLYCQNATPLTFTGFSGGVAGQRLTVIALSGAVNFAYNNSGSLGGNRLLNWITSAPTPLAAVTVAFGSATYIFSAVSSVWVLVAHEQGEWITPPFSAADYLAPWVMTGAGVIVCKYRVSGRLLSLILYLGGTTGAGAVLQRAVPGGFIPIGAPPQPCTLALTTAAGVSSSGMALFTGNTVAFYTTVASAGWGAGSVAIQCNLFGEIT